MRNNEALVSLYPLKAWRELYSEGRALAREPQKGKELAREEEASPSEEEEVRPQEDWSSETWVASMASAGRRP